MKTQKRSAILDLLNTAGIFDELKTSKKCDKLLEEMDWHEKVLIEHLNKAGAPEEVFKNYKECYDKLTSEYQDAAVLAAFKLGLEMGMEAGE